MKFEEKYFIQTNNTKRSNYEDYRKKKFDVLADDLIKLIPLEKHKRILDFGCATGGLIKELIERGFTNIKGTDVSYWAIHYGQQRLGLINELQFCNLNLLTQDFDVVLVLDILEHVPIEHELDRILGLIKSNLIVVRVPVSAKEGEPYVLDVSNNDPSHVQCHDKFWWIDRLAKYNYYTNKVLKGKSIYDSDGVLAMIFWRQKQ